MYLTFEVRTVTNVKVCLCLSDLSVNLHVITPQKVILSSGHVSLVSRICTELLLLLGCFLANKASMSPLQWEIWIVAGWRSVPRANSEM